MRSSWQQQQQQQQQHDKEAAAQQRSSSSSSLGQIQWAPAAADVCSGMYNADVASVCQCQCQCQKRHLQAISRLLVMAFSVLCWVMMADSVSSVQLGS
jgi:hypothetical protein